MATEAPSTPRKPTHELDWLTDKIIGCAIEVHRFLGPGFLEATYENALCVELQATGLTVQRQVIYPVMYRNAKVGWGQVQRWFLCRLLAPSDAVRPDQIEFVEADWVTPDQVVARAVEFRVPIYRRLISEFAAYLKSV